MKILIPHLDYTVHVKEAKNRPDQISHAEAWCVAVETGLECTIYLDTSKPLCVALLAHEVLHAVQFIARRKNISINDEMENMGGVMQYIMHRICQEYRITKPRVRIK